MLSMHVLSLYVRLFPSVRWREILSFHGITGLVGGYFTDVFSIEGLDDLHLIMFLVISTELERPD